MRNIAVIAEADGPVAPVYLDGEIGRRRVVIDEADYQELLALRAAEAARRPTPAPPEVSALVAKGHTRLHAWRVYRGIKQTQLANDAALSQGYLSLLESGVKTPSRLAKHFLALALDVTTATL